MSADYNNWKMVQNAKNIFKIKEWKTEAGVIIPLTGMKASFKLIYRDYSGEVALTLTTENGGIIINTLTSSITVTITTVQAKMVRYDNLVYELELIDSTNEVIPFLRGNVKYRKGNIA